MANLKIPDDVYSQLVNRASSKGLTVEQYVLPVLQIHAKADECTALDTSTKADSVAWQQRFELWQRKVAERSKKYPAHHQADTDRETIYGDRGMIRS